MEDRQRIAVILIVVVNTEDHQRRGRPVGLGGTRDHLVTARGTQQNQVEPLSKLLQPGGLTAFLWRVDPEVATLLRVLHLTVWIPRDRKIPDGIPRVREVGELGTRGRELMNLSYGGIGTLLEARVV